jgi:hypothetical protein
MNSLSWFLYLADTLPNIGGFAIFIAILFGFVSTLYVVAKGLANSGDNDAKAFVSVPVVGYSPLIFVLAVFVAILIPSKDTIYLIAGSEAGQFVVETPEAQEILNDVKDIIRLQLEDMKK